MTYDGKRLKWMHDLDSLKKIIQDLVGLQGKWSFPGGGSKRFKCINAKVVVTWYYKKQNTLFQGKFGNFLRDNFAYFCQTRDQAKPKSPDKVNDLVNEFFTGLVSLSNLSVRKSINSDNITNRINKR